MKWSYRSKIVPRAHVYERDLLSRLDGHVAEDWTVVSGRSPPLLWRREQTAAKGQR
jgi:hypothetical protein